MPLKYQQLTAIGLFSGGLDSFAGAAIWLQEHPYDVLGLLSIASSTVIGKTQRDLAEILTSEYHDRVCHLPVQLTLSRAPDAERSQRTRGFVFTAIATAAAHAARVDRVLIFENGYGSINPRVAGHQQGSHTTKSTHPFIINRLQQLYRSAGFDVRLELPYVLCTKSELVMKIPNSLLFGIGLTASCDGFPLRRKDVKQCGRCSSCILRQQALRHASLQDFDRTDYAESAFDGGEPSTPMLLMAYQARQFVELEPDYSLAEVARQWPEVVLGEERQPTLQQVEVIQVLRRFGLEWQTLIARDNALGERLGWKLAG